VLSSKEIHAVVIATPAETHFNIARESLLAGKHVYAEKPLVLREEEGRELIELARESSRVLMVGHLLQYHPVFIRLKELAHSGELGRINYIYSHRLNLGKIRREEIMCPIYKGITLEDGFFCGPSMVFTNIYNPRAEIGKMDQVRPTLVKKGTTIGANATIVCGTTLGRYCFIGAGAVVNKNIPDYALVVGNPAKQIGWACECGERLPDDLECLACEKKYRKDPSGLIVVG
jgi:acetyltransferase-like isoleucine patch superfamily enzyme